MATITSTGLGSGLDIESLVTKLITAERQPIVQIQAKQTTQNSKLSAWGQISSAVSTLQSAATALSTRSSFASLTASIGSSTVGSVAITGTPTAGTHSLTVTQLADALKIKSDTGYASKDTVIATAGSSFTITTGGTEQKITLEDGNNTLAGLAKAINNAGAGVSASIVNDGSSSTPYRLVLTATDTGTAGTFSIKGLTGFEYDPNATTSSSSTTTSTTTTTTSGFSVVQEAKNAEFTLDGISITKSSNTVTDVIDGVTLKLAATNKDSSTTITVATDTSSLTTKMQAFVSAYNALNSTIKVQTSYNADTKVAGTLNGEGTLRTLQSQLRSSLTGMVDGSYLSNFGITFQKDGSLALDTTKFTAAATNPDIDLGKFFVSENGTEGFAAQIASKTKAMLSDTGLITTRTSGIKSVVKDMTKQIDTLNDRIDSIETRYRAQFTALDKTLSSLNSTSLYLSKQLASLSN